MDLVYRDDVGRFLLASIVEKRGTKVKIHYEGWNSKWDKWYDYTQDLRKFARARSISRSLVYIHVCCCGCCFTKNC